jgi:hypothetical protein
MNVAEQIARCDEKIAEYEAEGRWKSTASWKATKTAILSHLADADGNIRIPKGDGSVTKTAEEIRADDAMHRARADDRAAAEAAAEAAEEGSEGEPAPPRRPRLNGATAGHHKRRRQGGLPDQIRQAEVNGDYARAASLKARLVHEGARSA